MKTIFIALLALVPAIAFSQSKEYIVKHNGDTIRGEVKILSKHVRVIKAPADTLTLNSEEVKFFGNGNIVKTVLRLTLYGYTDNLDEIQSSSYSNPVYDTTMLLTPLIAGEKMNLFTGKDKRKVVYFFVQMDGGMQPEQLLYAIGGAMPEKESWGRTYQYVNYVTHHKIFVNQILELTSACEDFVRGVNWIMLEYRESDLKALVKRYNKKCN